MSRNIFIDKSNDTLLNNQGDLDFFSPVEQSPEDGIYGLLVPTALLLGQNPNITFENDISDFSNHSKNLIVYGDIRDLIMTAKGRTHQADTYTPFYNAINDYVITLGSDEIKVGHGDNQLFGDFRDLILSAKGGIGRGGGTFLNGADAEGVIFRNTFTAGDDQITSGDGNNLVWGDGRNISLLSEGLPSLDGGLSFGTIRANIFTLGTDEIILGDGENVIYGDVQNITLKSTDIAHIGPSDIRNARFFFGEDNISVGNGDNQIFGDAQDIMLLALSTTNSMSQIFLGTNTSANRFTFASDIILTGDGNDIIYGDARTFLGLSQGGIGTQGNDAPPGWNLNFFTCIPDSITAGGGDDLIYGDFREFSLSAIGGKVTDAMGTRVGETDGLMLNNSFTFGSESGANLIEAGAGNDHVWGDAHTLSLVAQGGTVINTGNAQALIINTFITLGNDTIHGDLGHDVLFGDLETLSIVAIDGAVISGTGNVAARFSGDVVFPDDGSTAPDVGSIISFGDDIIDGGSGNDFLSGDAMNVSGLADFLEDLNPDPSIFNQIIWGNDTLTGGSGADIFAFTLVDLDGDGNLEMQGNDTVADFVIADGDKLQFKGVDNLATLNTAAVSFEVNQEVDGDLNSDDTIIIFDNNTSITLYDITLSMFGTEVEIVV